MDNRPKTFDINAPSSPSPNSRPIIVGHQPMMADPMMRPANAPAPAEEPSPAVVHKAKVIAVSDEMRQNLTQSQPEETPPPTPQAQQISPVAEAPAAAASQTLVTSEVPAPAITGTPPATMETPMPEAAPAAQLPQAPTPDLSNIPHVPVSHNHSGHTSGKSGILAWLAVAVILIALAVYLLMDVGLISGGSSLPFRIFGQ